MSEISAYYNGDWIPQQQLAVPIDDLGFTLGATIVERMRTFAGKVFRKTEHLERLRRSLELVGWNVDELVADVSTAIDGFVERNAGGFVPGDDWYIVALVTPGCSPQATSPTICIHGGPLRFAGWAHQYSEGVKVAIVDTRQVPPNCWSPEIKCRSRLHYYLADREAAAKAPGARAVLLDQDGFVGEASTANVVAYYANRGLVTPPREKVLPGVTQQVLFELADKLGIAHSETDITPAELMQAEEVYLTSTSVCVLPVVQIDEQPIGDGKPGEVYEQLLGAWKEMIGVDIAGQAEKYSVRDD